MIKIKKIHLSNDKRLASLAYHSELNNIALRSLTSFGASS
jgi:hypothetical protein